MVGTVLKRHPTVDGPYPDVLPPRSFTIDQVAAFGKLARYGDFVVRYIVRLVDGTEAFVNASEHDGDEARWLRRLARRVPTPRRGLSRDACTNIN